VKTILIADDNEPFRTLLAKGLQTAGYEVLAAADGAAALKICRQQSVDLAIIDLIMPVKEGLETINELHCAQPQLKIIAMSGDSSFFAAEDYLKIAGMLGAAKTLVKPFHWEEIIGAVAEMLPSSSEDPQAPSAIRSLAASLSRP
jgi:DNA-binding response OmpR family regulator